MNSDKRVNVSVVMGVYNQTDVSALTLAVHSITRQTTEDMECIIVDDGSDARCAGYLRQIAKKSPSIRLIRQEENKGLGAALNVAIDLAKGRYIARMDADDISAPHRIKRQIQFLEEHPAYAWCGIDAVLFDADGIWGIREYPNEPKAEDYLKYSPYLHPSVVFRRTIFDGGIRYREDEESLRCEDYVLFLTLYKKGLRGANLHEALYYYREDKTSYARRTWRARMNETRMRRAMFSGLPVGRVSWELATIRPVIGGCMPRWFIRGIKRTQAIRCAKDGGNANNPYAGSMQLAAEKRFKRYKRILKSEPTLYAAANEVRMQSIIEDDIDFTDVLYGTYLYTFAPAVFSFSLWVLKAAEQAGIHRLYFLSRDAYSVYGVAERIAKGYGIPIKLRYLFVSRYTLRLAEYAILKKEDIIDTLCLGGTDVTIDGILQRVGLDAKESDKILQKLSDYRSDQKLDYRDLQQLKERLWEIPELFSYIRTHAQAAYEKLTGYLRQEKLYDAGSIGIVDSGWIGTTQRSMERLVGRRMKGFYFGLYDLPREVDPRQVDTFYFKPQDHILRKVTFSNSLYEAVVSAPDGMTCGYEKKQDDYYPVYTANGNPNADAIRVFDQIQQQYADSVLRQMRQEGHRRMKTGGLAILTERLFTALMQHPTKDEAEAFGSIGFDDDVMGHTLQDAARKLSKEELRCHYLLRKIAIKLHLRAGELTESAWEQGSIIRSGGGIRLLLSERIYRMMMYVRKAVGYRCLR